MATQVPLDDCLSIRDGRLYIEECDAAALARRVADVFARDLVPDRLRCARTSTGR